MIDQWGCFFSFWLMYLLLCVNVLQVMSAREKTCWLMVVATSMLPAQGSTFVKAAWPMAAVASTSIVCLAAFSRIRLICLRLKTSL